ncbi:MAG TPA: Hsp20/alpha crystallin family protein [bacterium]|jgi:HSP20 family protein
MSITRWQPVDSELRPFFTGTWRPLTRMMEEFLNNAQPSEMSLWGPNVDIVENADGFEIHAELPGVKQEEVKITLHDNVLTLSGEKRQEIKENKDNLLRVERNYGRFERSFSLPTTVKPEDVRAQFEDGVLKITLPKAETAKARQIQIETRK